MVPADDPSPGPVPPADMVAVIDVSNRINRAFDDWDIPALLALLDPELVMAHPRGDVVGIDSFVTFLDGYRPFTLGCRRHALNHIVDAGADGTLRVTSYLLILRVVPTAASEAFASETYHAADPGLPRIVLSSRVSDVLRRDDEAGWRLLRRDVDRIVETADAQS